MENNNYICFYDNYWECKLPIQGSDNSELLQMGFEFGPFADGDKLRFSKLPSGWTRADTDQKYWSNILDTRQRVRVRIFDFKENAYINVIRRFSTSHEQENLAITFYVWDNDYAINEKCVSVFSKRFVLPDQAVFKDIYKQKATAYILQDVSGKWLDETLPKWKSYCAYWNEDLFKE
ncbi:MAG: hypothetical protein Q8P20_00355 [bacterium]|nr:hypothetical protein [bacterium]